MLTIIYETVLLRMGHKRENLAHKKQIIKLSYIHQYSISACDKFKSNLKDKLRKIYYTQF